MQGQGNARGGGSDGTSQSSAGRSPCDDCGIVREADHRIANHLALLAGFVRLRASDLARRTDEPKGEDFHLILGDISAQILAIGHLHRSMTRRESVVADLAEYLRDICASLSLFCGPVEIIGDFAEGCALQPDQVLPLTQIVSEVLVNAVKYARPRNGQPKILARCFRDNAGRIRIEIADNGIGLPATFDAERGGGLGFSLLRALAGQLQAGIEFQSSDDGLRFCLTLPQASRSGSAGPPVG